MMMYDDFIRRVHKHRTNPNLSRQIQKCVDYIEMNLFQCVLSASFHAEVVNDEQGIAAELVHNIVPPGKAAVQLVQDSGEVCHTHRHFLLHQSVCNAPGKETLACTHTAPEEQPKVLCAHGLPLLYIAVCVVHLWAAAIVVFKGPVQH